LHSWQDGHEEGLEEELEGMASAGQELKIGTVRRTPAQEFFLRLSNCDHASKKIVQAGRFKCFNFAFSGVLLVK
jgi:hypothetical protein